MGTAEVSAPPDCVRCLPGWLGSNAEPMFAELRAALAWEQRDISLFGRTVPTPRLTVWVGDAAYRYSGVVNEPSPWPATLAEIRDRLVTELGVPFNSCLVNLYRDGSDSMGYHSDNEPELGDRPAIASVSLGARRTFLLRHRTSRERWSWELGEGDLLLMTGESQSDYAHAVPKTARPIGARMNLTFRVFG